MKFGCGVTGRVGCEGGLYSGKQAKCFLIKAKDFVLFQLGKKRPTHRHIARKWYTDTVREQIPGKWAIKKITKKQLIKVIAHNIRAQIDFPPQNFPSKSENRKINQKINQKINPSFKRISTCILVMPSFVSQTNFNQKKFQIVSASFFLSQDVDFRMKKLPFS